jgi:hypothetical protein
LILSNQLNAPLPDGLLCDFRSHLLVPKVPVIDSSIGRHDDRVLHARYEVDELGLEVEHQFWINPHDPQEVLAGLGLKGRQAEGPEQLEASSAQVYQVRLALHEASVYDVHQIVSILVSGGNAAFGGTAVAPAADAVLLDGRHPGAL